MVFSFRGASPIKTRVKLTFAAVIIVLLAVPGYSLLRNQTGDISPGPAATETSAGLGFSYLPVTGPVSSYYNLGVDSGVLVTEVTPSSPAEQAGVEVGDIILSFNSKRLDGQASLLGMIMSCPAGNEVTLEVWRADNRVIVSFIHMNREED